MLRTIKNGIEKVKSKSVKMAHELWIKKVEGIGVVEIILILAILIALVIIFKDQISSIVSNILNKINTDVSTI